MAYNAAGFRTIAQGGSADSAADELGMSIHAYISDDALSVVVGSGYFNNAADNIKTGDLVLVSGDYDGTQAAQLYVLINTSGTITSTAAA